MRACVHVCVCLHVCVHLNACVQCRHCLMHVYGLLNTMSSVIAIYFNYKCYAFCSFHSLEPNSMLLDFTLITAQYWTRACEVLRMKVLTWTTSLELVSLTPLQVTHDYTQGGLTLISHLLWNQALQ